MTRAELNVYIGKKRKELQGKENSFSFPPAAEIAAYASTKEFGPKKSNGIISTQSHFDAFAGCRSM